MCKELLIPPGTQNYVVRMRLYDVNKRLLCLTIRIVLRAQGALKILISAPYWLVNKTGMLSDLCIDYRLMIWIQNLNRTQLYCTTAVIFPLIIVSAGLPLIFRQDNGKTDAAGQFEEHELARSLSPLLFCYTDKEQPNMWVQEKGKIQRILIVGSYHPHPSNAFVYLI